MIVDIHTHTFPDKIAASTVDKLQHMSHTTPFSDGTAAGLAQKAAAAGIDWSVVLPVATNPHQVPHVNDASLRLCEAFHDRGLISFGCIHPDYDGWKEELDRIAAQGIKGVKLHPVYQGVDLDDIRFLRIMDRCGELGLTVITHAGLDVGYPGVVRCSPEMALHAVREVGPFQFILAHMGGWHNWEQVERLLPGTGVYLDCSFSLGKLPLNSDPDPIPWPLDMMGQEQLRMVGAFGADHILFGTDSPWGDQARELERIRSIPLPQADIDAILGGNAARLLGL